MEIKSFLKFFLKMRIVDPLRRLFLFFFGQSPNINNWGKRMLIVNIQALGDLVVFTSVLKHYKKRFSDQEIFLLIKRGTGAEQLLAPFADRVLMLDYRKFSVNPFYGLRFINGLRGIGFKKVVNQDWSAAEIMGEIISVSVGAEETVCYEGLLSEFREPFDFNHRKNMEIVKHNIHPRYTKIIPSIDSGVSKSGELFSSVRQYAAVYEGAMGFRESDYATEIPVVLDEGEATAFLGRFGLSAGAYAILNVNASVDYKRWPLARFAEVAKFLDKDGFKIVLTGSRSERAMTERFEKMCSVLCVNLAGATSLSELVIALKNAALVFTNDTSMAHLAVALKKPLLCVTGGGHFGMFSNYGYASLHRWAYTKLPCYGDNWHCGRALPADTPAPCLNAVSTEMALAELRDLIQTIKKDPRPRAGEKFRY